MEQILILCDDWWHPAEVIERGICGLGKNEYQFDVVKAAKDILTWDFIEQFQAIICCKGNNVTAANQQPWFEDGVHEIGPEDFFKYIESGHGFIAVHSACTFSEHSCKRQEEKFLNPCRKFQMLIGNHFIGHPARCNINVWVSDPLHPVAQGIDSFTVHDEHYQITDLAPDAKPFLYSTSESGGTQIAGYTRELGKGRMSVITLGHTVAVWEHPAFRKLIMNSLKWCLQKK